MKYGYLKVEEDAKYPLSSFISPIIDSRFWRLGLIIYRICYWLCRKQDKGMVMACLKSSLLLLREIILKILESFCMLPLLVYYSFLKDYGWCFQISCISFHNFHIIFQHFLSYFHTIIQKLYKDELMVWERCIFLLPIFL